MISMFEKIRPLARIIVDDIKNNPKSWSTPQDWHGKKGVLKLWATSKACYIEIYNKTYEPDTTYYFNKKEHRYLKKALVKHYRWQQERNENLLIAKIQ